MPAPDLHPPQVWVHVELVCARARVCLCVSNENSMIQIHASVPQVARASPRQKSLDSSYLARSISRLARLARLAIAPPPPFIRSLWCNGCPLTRNAAAQMEPLNTEKVKSRWSLCTRQPGKPEAKPGSVFLLLFESYEGRETKTDLATNSRTLSK